MSSFGGDHQEVRFEEFVDPVDGVRWRVDMDFIESNWTCTWGDGCQGILDHPAEELQQGCCSVGAELIDKDEARKIAALGLTLNPDRFQFHAEAEADGVFNDESQGATRVLEGACIFLNRPGYPGGEGCALHLGAVDDEEPPMDWKPSICWQLPLKVETSGVETVRTLRRWERRDWGAGGRTMAWCCSEREHEDRMAPSAYVGDRPVAESLFDEISGLVGPDVAVEIRSRVQRG